MQTNFSADQLADPHMRESEKILRSCVHCGFCTATCPTYLLLGDELDSPRGRIYLIKDMLENGKPATKEVVKHVDRCLSCLSCMTTCPSGVHYMHLVDHARAHIEKTFVRGIADRLLRALLAHVLPYPKRFRLALASARFARPLRHVFARLPSVGPHMAAMLELAPRRFPRRQITGAAPANASRRVIMLEGCAQPLLAPSINAAARRVLARAGVEVMDAPGEGCCGALVHHMGREEQALGFARRNVDAWIARMDRDGAEAIVVTASGCGTTIKDYGFMLREDAAYAQKAQRVSAATKDITEYLCSLDTLAVARQDKIVVAYHSACSMQHGQQIRDEPKRLLREAGFVVRDVPEGHICCGSAGVYNILQPEIAGQLRARKVANVERMKPAIIATGNIGCITQIGAGTALPIAHTVELIDWAQGGPLPVALEESGFLR
ncbi:MAG: glycolate oxidase subunit GlcF [Beijerinckiaceae bacterium]|nr:glycolate oxidase subunit GlcF [Beijerinckiaceae bacterium]